MHYSIFISVFKTFSFHFVKMQGVRMKPNRSHRVFFSFLFSPTVALSPPSPPPLKLDFQSLTFVLPNLGCWLVLHSITPPVQVGLEQMQSSKSLVPCMTAHLMRRKGLRQSAGPSTLTINVRNTISIYSNMCSAVGEFPFMLLTWT